MIARTQMICLAGLVLGDFMLALVSVWLSPTSVPVHWNFRGEVDRYGSPWELAIIFPATVVLVAGLLVALPAMGRLGAALERSRTAYGRVAIAVVGLLVAIHAVAVVLGPTHPLDVAPAIMICTGMLLAAVGNWMGKIRRNSVVGIRTRWTLKSDVIWERTHRIGGRLQVIHGLAIIIAACLFPSWVSVAVLFAGLFGLTAWAVAYSWSLDRSDRVVKAE